MSPHVTTMSAYYAQADVESASSLMNGFRCITTGSDVSNRIPSPKLNRAHDSSRTTLIDDLFWIEGEADNLTTLEQMPLVTPEAELPIYVPFEPIAVRRLKGRVVRRMDLTPNPILPEA